MNLPRPAPGEVLVTFLDVGQGTATLVVDGTTRNALLVDCPAGREEVVLDALAQTESTLHAVIVSHWDQDHVGGVPGLMDAAGCAHAVYNNDHGPETPTARAQARAIGAHRRRGTHVRTRAVVDVPLPGDLGRVTYRALAPDDATDAEAEEQHARNRGSVVVRVDVPSPTAGGTNRSVLLAGDADAVSLRRALARTPTDFRVDYASWPHHGAFTGGLHFTASLLAALGPAEIHFSVGSGNPYGHPDARVVVAAAAAAPAIVCSQVTGRCHGRPSPPGETPCAGTVAHLIRADGGASRTPDRTAHARTVDGWLSPLCRTAPTPATAPAA